MLCLSDHKHFSELVYRKYVTHTNSCFLRTTLRLTSWTSASRTCHTINRLSTVHIMVWLCCTLSCDLNLDCDAVYECLYLSCCELDSCLQSCVLGRTWYIDEEQFVLWITCVVSNRCNVFYSRKRTRTTSGWHQTSQWAWGMLVWSSALRKSSRYCTVQQHSHNKNGFICHKLQQKNMHIPSELIFLNNAFCLFFCKSVCCVWDTLWHKTLMFAIVLLLVGGKLWYFTILHILVCHGNVAWHCIGVTSYCIAQSDVPLYSQWIV